MRGCFERNGSAQNGSKRSCKRIAYPYLRGTVPYRSKVPCKRSLCLSDEGWKSSGRGTKILSTQMKRIKNKEHSSEVLEGISILRKSGRGYEHSIKYMRLSPTPSPQVMRNPSLTHYQLESVFAFTTVYCVLLLRYRVYFVAATMLISLRHLWFI